MYVLAPTRVGAAECAAGTVAVTVTGAAAFATGAAVTVTVTVEIYAGTWLVVDRPQAIVRALEVPKDEANELVSVANLASVRM